NQSVSEPFASKTGFIELDVSISQIVLSGVRKSRNGAAKSNTNPTTITVKNPQIIVGIPL
ncbi:MULTISPECIES: hypothetical protein, partial [Vibrio]|uniref:hypothetical protein n=1 Tax=Vibrio TaxID=662 RepID=UPI001CDCC56B